MEGRCPLSAMVSMLGLPGYEIAVALVSPKSVDYGVKACFKRSNSAEMNATVDTTLIDKVWSALKPLFYILKQAFG